MKKNKKRTAIRLLLILILLVIIALGVIYFFVRPKQEKEPEVYQNVVVEEYVQVLADGTKINTSEKLKETKKVNGLQFSNIELTNKNGQTVLLADVKNKNAEATELVVVNIILVDKDGNTITEVGGIVKGLNPGESTQFNTGTSFDYTNSYDFKVTVNEI